MTTLTGQVKQQLSEYLVQGDIAVDATAGNGHDTLFLARQVGAEGKVFAFDIQQQAIDKTGKLLLQQQPAADVSLIKKSHDQLLRQIPQIFHQHISVIMFNLGYLPGSDKTCITTRQTTLPALRQAMQLLKPGGLLSIMLYPGHAGGKKETDAVLHWTGLLAENTVQQHIVTNGPQWLLLKKTL